MTKAAIIEVSHGVIVTTMPVTRLSAAPYNPRFMSDEVRKRLAGSLAKFGLVELPVFNKRTGQLVGGHQRVRWLREQGVASCAVIVVDLDEADEKVLNITLNNSHVRGEFTSDLGALLKSVQADSPATFGDLGLGALLKQVSVSAHTRTVSQGGGGEEPPDLDTRAEPVTRPGDVIELGRHRLVCGDAHVAADVDRLLDGAQVAMVATDPPYAIYGSSSGIGADIADDKMVRPFFTATGRLIHGVLPLHGHAYVFCDWRSYATLVPCIRDSGLVLKNSLIWDKASGLGANYGNAYEMIPFFSKMLPPKGMKAAAATGQRTVNGKQNILRYPKVTGDDRLVNAAKPVPLVIELLENSSDEGEIVADFFGGSGTTLIAADRCGRRCLTMELEPRHCDIIIERWRRETNGEPRVL